MLKAENRAPGCGPAPFPKVFTSKSQHYTSQDRRAGQKPQGSRSSACSCWAAAMGSASIHIPAVKAKQAAGWHSLSSP